MKTTRMQGEYVSGLTAAQYACIYVGYTQLYHCTNTPVHQTYHSQHEYIDCCMHATPCDALTVHHFHDIASVNEGQRQYITAISMPAQRKVTQIF